MLEYIMMRLELEPLIATGELSDGSTALFLRECFGCGEDLTDEEIKAGRGICEECYQRRVWERN